ncbi:transmembrane protein 222-like [Agrilus planipennis]|uniref:Transmembrane protein 222 n=1 Tax=Agrilus planipennis TaxID=224129 RepID=A0A1W4XP61_AGRPL|nr:transmembrane protein 222 [Agrilus planipennis]XP_025835209.1 transmembrane protein 222-like [Agrilus planipennis]
MSRYQLMEGINNNSAPQCENVAQIDKAHDRFPFCIVWTPIPFLTWLFPIIGHMGIAMSSGVIRDFAGPFFVSEDNMAFGRPTKYWQLDPSKARGSISGWDHSVREASEIYKGRMHHLLCDNCHSHVATALNLMKYDNANWNMVKLAILMPFYSRYVSFSAVLKTWVPFLVILIVAVILCTVL